jgi:hypothetical protein
MNARTLRLGLATLAALALATSAWAQDQDAYLQRYGIAVDGLRNAVATVDSDAVSARENVDRAFNALLTLSRDAAGSTLVVAMERVFERARTAISNGSVDDLAVQAAVLEGGFQRLAYEAALRAAVDGDLELARTRLGRIADDIGFSESDRVALVDPSQPASALRFHLEAGVADVMATRLAVARELAATNTGASYRALARAYGHFLLVQDSPRAEGSLNGGFVRAASALVAGETALVVDALTEVEAGIAELATAARERRTSVPGGGVTLTEPSLLPSVDAEATTEADIEGEAPPTEPVEVVDDLDEGEAITEARLAEILLARDEAVRREQLDGLLAELNGAGMPAGAAPAHAERLLDAGYLSLEDVRAELGGAAARATAAAHRGADTEAHVALATAAEGYATWLSPILRPSSPNLDTETVGLFARLGETRPLRVQDTAVVAGQLEAVQASLAGESPSAVQRGARTTTSVWAGVVRDVVTLAIGLLALVPLFLLNIAFGGGNRNWQAIGVALLLLLLPALFEGVIGLGGLLATYVGIDTLLPLSAFSVFDSVAAQTVWAATTLLAIIFSATGLVGISRQFGLLGGRRGTGRRRSATPAVARPSATTGTAGTVDWDDDL